MTALYRLVVFLLLCLLSALVFWACNVSESGKPDTLTFALDDTLKTSSGNYDSVQLDLYVITGKDTAFRRTLFRGEYENPAQLENLSLGENISGNFVIRVIGYRDDVRILEAGVPFSNGRASKIPIVYISPADHPIKRSPAFVSGMENASMLEGETKRIIIKAKDPDGDTIGFVIQNLDSLRARFPEGGKAIQVMAMGDSLVVTFSPGSASGNYRFRIALIDSAGPAVVQILVISVGKVNRPPALAFASSNPGPGFFVREGKALSFKVVAVDPDSGDAAMLLALDLPPWPECGQGGYDTATGVLNFTPSFRCADTGTLALSDLIFRARDKGVPQEVGSLTARITVLDSNSAPNWKQDSAAAAGKEGREMSLDLSALFMGDREQDSVAFTVTCGAVLQTPLRWSFTPGFRDSGGKRCEITAEDSHKPPASARLILNLTIADSVRAVDVAILSPARGHVTRDTQVVVQWKVGDQKQVADTVEILGKEGSNLIRRAFKDSLGNSGEDTLTVFRDTQPPKRPTVSVSPLTNKPNPKWTWKGGGGGNGQFRIKVDAADLATGAMEIKDTAYSPTQALLHGRHVLYVQERDDAGNWSAVDSGVVQVDLIAPVVEITAPLDGHVTNQASVKIEWSVDGVEQTPGDQTLVEDGNAISKTVTDSAGNTGSISITVTRRSQVVFVNASAAAGGDGNSWATAYISLQDGLAKSLSGWEVWVAKGAYAPNAGLPSGVDTSFVMKGSAAMLGGFAGTETIKTARDWKANETIISGDPIVTGLPSGSSSSPLVKGAVGGRLDGFIVEKGRSYLGSGLNASAFASITVANCVFRNHEGTAEEGGGAIQSYGSNFSVSNSEFISNTNTGEGGAISLLGTNATISNCKFIGNRSMRPGGALYVSKDASVTISNSTFQGNVSQSSGGAVAHRGWIEIRNSYLLENSSGQDGGAIYSQLDYLTLSNCVFANNSADQNGGGLFVFFSNLSGSNVTFHGNAAKDAGGALYFAGSEYSSSSVSLQNSIIWGNTSSSSANQIALNPAIFRNAIFTLEYSVIEGGVSGVSKPDSSNWITGPGVISSDPRFRDPSNLAGSDRVLMTSDDGLSLNGGPAVNSGKLSNSPSTDITGSIRPKGGYVDMGAYEP